jgi:photosystem II stability/assembly factor-like uncharacterized protein
MLRRSRFISALAVAACGLLAASCSAATPAQSSQVQSSQARDADSLSAGPDPEYTAVAFPRAASGWLLGQPASGAARAEIWHSVTAGRTWQPQWQGPGDPLALSATDPAHAWALIACPGPALESQGSSCTRTLIGTSDAGLHWRVIARLPAAVNDVRFFSGGLGVATSDRCLAVPSTTRCPGQLLVSRDGGAHWTPVLTAPGPVFATAAADGQLWAAEPSGSVISFLASTDGGRHWTQLRPALAPTGLLDVLSPGTALGAQDVGDAGAILRSADGGHSWTKLADLPGVVTQLSFPSSADGIAATYQASAPAGASAWRLWRSRDGGRPDRPRAEPDHR